MWKTEKSWTQKTAQPTYWLFSFHISIICFPPALRMSLYKIYAPASSLGKIWKWSWAIAVWYFPVNLVPSHTVHASKKMKMLNFGSVFLTIAGLSPRWFQALHIHIPEQHYNHYKSYNRAQGHSYTWYMKIKYGKFVAVFVHWVFYVGCLPLIWFLEQIESIHSGVL